MYYREVCAKVFYIDEPGGTGKACIYNTLLAKVRSRGEIALAVASSGIADLLLDQVSQSKISCGPKMKFG